METEDDGSTSRKRSLRTHLRIQVPASPDMMDVESEGTLTIGGEKVSCGPGDLQHVRFLGEGESGVVDEMRHRASGAALAVKRIRVNPKDVRTLLDAVDHARNCGPCPHVVNLYGAFFRERYVSLCMELMDTSLDRLHRAVCERGERMPEHVITNMALSILKGLDFLYSKVKVKQRDLKPADILLNSRGEVKLSDFGVKVAHIGGLARARTGDFGPYMAPNRIDPPDRSSRHLGDESHEERDVTHDQSTDVWSLGIILFEIATGSYPYPEYKSLFELLVKIVQQDPPQLPPGEFSDEFQDFISQCLKKDFRERATFEQLMNHPLLEKAAARDVDMAAYFCSYGDLTKL